MNLPESLHGQLYLLAYDRRRHRFDLTNLWLLGFALRAAMLTDMCLGGHLEDDDGVPRAVRPPTNPVLHKVFEAIRADGTKTWEWSICVGQEDAPGLVRDELSSRGWLCMQPRRRLGLLRTHRLGVCDEDMVGALADRVHRAVENAFADRPAEPRPLAVGLLGAIAEMSTVYSVASSTHDAVGFQELVSETIAPIAGLHDAVESIYSEMGGRRRGGTGACGGGGCGGGCGGG